MQSFWDGFEKRAVSTKFIAKGMAGRMRNQKKDLWLKVLYNILPGTSSKGMHKVVDEMVERDLLPAVRKLGPPADLAKAKHTALRGFLEGFSETYPKGVM